MIHMVNYLNITITIKNKYKLDKSISSCGKLLSLYHRKFFSILPFKLDKQLP